MKNLIRKVFVGTMIAGSLFLNNCEVGLSGDLTIKEEGLGEITGRIIWDPYEDGNYGGVSADIGLDTWPWLNAKYETRSTSEGNFSFHEVPVKTYTIYVQKKVDNSKLWHYWRAKKGFTVLKQQVSNVGDIEIKAYSGPGY